MRATNRIDQQMTNILMKVKGEDRFIFLYDDGREEEVLEAIGEWAGSTDLIEFTWLDAAKLSAKVREETSCPT